eukprot:scaffold3719_cov247-Pinguiococcus_pyrenoidosus.AAC.13
MTLFSDVFDDRFAPGGALRGARRQELLKMAHACPGTQIRRLPRLDARARYSSSRSASGLLRGAAET